MYTTITWYVLEWPADTKINLMSTVAGELGRSNNSMVLVGSICGTALSPGAAWLLHQHPCAYAYAYMMTNDCSSTMIEASLVRGRPACRARRQ